jgi:thiol:disulfide interchange protein DsbA
MEPHRPVVVFNRASTIFREILSMKQFAILGVLLMGFSTVALAQQGQEPYTEGTHYFSLNQAAPARQSDVITVTELFSYGCHACNEFEPFMQNWKSQLPEDVKLNRIPVGFGRAAWELLAKGYVMAEILGVEEQAHLPLMNAIWKDGAQMRSIENLADFYSQHGADRAKYLALDGGFMLNMRLKQNMDKLGLYAPRGTPTMVVNGKYKIQTGKDVPSYEAMLQVVDFLVAKERAAKMVVTDVPGAAVTEAVAETSTQ